MKTTDQKAAKKIILIVTILLAVVTISCAQDSWIQKADFGGSARHEATGFSIGSKGFIGTGTDNNYPYHQKDFWEYDSDANTWSQKADFGGTARYGAASFSIGNKGYIGLGTSYTEDNYPYDTKDFWEYDPDNNSWTEKADFGGTARQRAVGFSIGSKGYFGTGYDTNLKKDFWEYDQGADTWTQKTDFGGTPRYLAIGFSLNSKGYVGTGYGPSFNNDFWKYDPEADSWTQKKDFGGTARYWAVGFGIGSKGYIGTGTDQNPPYETKDFWEYNPDDNTWIEKAEFMGTARYSAIGFSIGNKGYIGTGRHLDGSYNKDFYEYLPCDNGSNVYVDSDGDGYGNVASSIFVADCIAPDGYVKNSTDCNDTNASINPGALETTNDIDDNCNGIVDEGGSECLLPDEFSTGNITATSAELDWDAVPGAISYKVRYKVARSSPWLKFTTPETAAEIEGLLANTKYVWQVRTNCAKNPDVYSLWSEKLKFTTAEFRIGNEPATSFKVYPNPFISSSIITFYLNQDSKVIIELYDETGKKLQTVLDENSAVGKHEVNLTRQSLAAGIYFLKLITADGVMTEKVVMQ